MITTPQHRRLLPVLLPVLITAAAAVLVAAPADPAAHATSSAPADPLRRDLAAVVDGGATSALAVVRVDGRSPVSASAGLRRLGRPGAVDPSGRFRIGSVTKSFLATVVLQLVDEGRVRLDDPIGRYLPGVQAGPAITVRMLLDHTSGLYNLTRTLPLDPPSGFLAIRWRHWTPQELLTRATAHPLVFKPGYGYAYSDTDYLVLGMLVHRITGHSPAVEISRRIIGPLHLRETTEPRTTGVAGPHARAYLPMPDGTLADITRFDPSVLRWGGELISSGADLNRFLRALTGGQLLRPATTRLMRTVEWPAQSYGLGLRLLPLTCNATAVGHDGDVPGSSTWSYVLPGTGRAVTVSTSWGTGRPKDAVVHLVDDALCGRLGRAG